MPCPWKKCTNTYESSAKVVEGNLILSLPDAVNPIVWRMELGNVKASALEVRAGTADGLFVLSLKTPKGESHDVAPFDSREKAVHALMCVSNAMQNAERGLSAPLPGYAAMPDGGKKQKMGIWKWLLVLVGVLLIIFLFSYLGNVAPRTGDVSAVSGPGESEGESGIPQSADEMLKGF